MIMAGSIAPRAKTLRPSGRLAHGLIHLAFDPVELVALSLDGNEHALVGGVAKSDVHCGASLLSNLN